MMSAVDLVYKRPLQIAILGILWREGQLPLWRVERAVEVEYKPVKRSTVSTTLSRMISNKLVNRCNRHYYHANVTREQLIEQVTTAIVTAIEKA